MVTALAPHEIAEAFFAHSRRLDDAERAFFVERGISAPALDADPYCESGPVRSARVVFAEPFFDFSSEDDCDAAQAFVVIARGWDGVTADIAAFDDNRLALWLGRPAVIGEQHVLGWRLGEPLRVFEDVWLWLRGERDGVVPIDWKRTASLLEGVTLGVDSVPFGQVLRERLTRPAPPIFVREAHHEIGRLHQSRRGRAQAVHRRASAAQRAERAGRKSADNRTAHRRD